MSGHTESIEKGLSADSPFFDQHDIYILMSRSALDE